MYRPRRLRLNEQIRELVRETQLRVKDFIYPLFVVEGASIKREIPSMPDQYHYSVDMLSEEIKKIEALNIGAVLLFGIPEKKDTRGSESYAQDGIVQRAVREIKRVCPKILVVTDVCMCAYTEHGHCGILDEYGQVDNDKTLLYLSEIAVSHANAGADMVAPSDMMDGRVHAIRQALDEDGFINTAIMAYSVKYASCFYGPFRNAAKSAPSMGDRKGYQMDGANINEALKEARLDENEGADILMVKPALPYLDVVRKVKDNTLLPVATYNVSGEYSMLKHAVNAGILPKEAIMETVLSMKRAGADLIITYFAKEVVKALNGN
ncbi:MAG: porphobilinogen synthase [Synergistaceae bacterium]|nr:porphobilinogen synthase [Synergistaceae bacterium]